MITGTELIERVNIKRFEILEHIEKGLPAYNPLTGTRIIVRDNKKISSPKEVEEFFRRRDAEKGIAIRQSKPNESPNRKSKEIIKGVPSVNKILEHFVTYIDRDRENKIQEALKYLFRIHEVNDYGAKIGWPRIDRKSATTPPAAKEEPETEAPRNIWRRKGENWEIAYGGKPILISACAPGHNETSMFRYVKYLIEHHQGASNNIQAQDLERFVDSEACETMKEGDLIEDGLSSDEGKDNPEIYLDEKGQKKIILEYKKLKSGGFTKKAEEIAMFAKKTYGFDVKKERFGEKWDGDKKISMAKKEPSKNDKAHNRISNKKGRMIKRIKRQSDELANLIDSSIRYKDGRYWFESKNNIKWDL